MAQIVQIGKKSTIIEGTETEINEIRQKLHDLGFNFENYQYIELQEIQPQKVNTQPQSNQTVGSIKPPASSQTASTQKPAQATQQTPAPKPVAAQNPPPVSRPAATNSTPASQTAAAAAATTTANSEKASKSEVQTDSRFPYKISPINNGYEIFIPQSKMDIILKQFPIVRNKQKTKMCKKNPEKEDSTFFFNLKQSSVEFTIHPIETYSDHIIEVALRLLSLIE